MYIYIYIKQVKQESRLTPSKDDHKMRCILEALQVYIYMYIIWAKKKL